MVITKAFADPTKNELIFDKINDQTSCQILIFPDCIIARLSGMDKQFQCALKKDNWNDIHITRDGMDISITIGGKQVKGSGSVTFFEDEISGQTITFPKRGKLQLANTSILNEDYL